MPIRPEELKKIRAKAIEDAVHEFIETLHEPIDRVLLTAQVDDKGRYVVDLFDNGEGSITITLRAVLAPSDPRHFSFVSTFAEIYKSFGWSTEYDSHNKLWLFSPIREDDLKEGNRG